MKIEISHLRKEYKKGGTVLKDFNAVINDGDAISVIGPSGCGKSTFLRCLNLLEKPTGGEITVDGLEIVHSKENFEKVRQRIGMVFQHFNLLDHLTVIENVMFAPIKIRNLSRQEAYDIAYDKLKLVGLEKHLLSYPDELSGGQKQRVAIARTLAMDPEVILFDEPTSALDPSMVKEVASIILRLREMKKTLVVVTHEMQFARQICNRVFYVDRGVLYEEGTPEEIFEAPKRERTKAFIRNLKVFRYQFDTNAFNFEEYIRSLNLFLANNVIGEELAARLKKAANVVVSDYVSDLFNDPVKTNVLIEYNEDKGSAGFLVYCARDPGEDLKKALAPHVRSVVIEETDDPHYEARLLCEI